MSRWVFIAFIALGDSDVELNAKVTWYVDVGVGGATEPRESGASGR